MICPNCKIKLKVTDSRQKPGNVTKRWLRCKICDWFGISEERFVVDKPKKINKNH